MADVKYKQAEPSDLDNDTDEFLWRVRATLMRLKRPRRVEPLRPWVAALIEPGDLNDEGGALLNHKCPQDLPFGCEDKECSVCFPQYFPAQYNVSDAKARQAINALVGSISTDLQYLRKTVPAHATWISERWRKKTRTKRSTFLKANSELFPERYGALRLVQMAADASQFEDIMHGAAHHAWRDACADDWTAHQVANYLGPMFSRGFYKVLARDGRKQFHKEFRDTWLMPYLDVPTLSDEPSRLLGLLVNRTAYDPPAWIGHDVSQLVLAEHFSIVSHNFNKHCVSLDPASYGALVPWDAEQAHTWRIVGFGKAFYLLSAQAQMLGLLRRLVTALLHEIRGTGLTPCLMTHQWKTILGSKGLTVGFTGSQYTNHPFSAPPKCQPAALLRIVTTGYNKIMDELELLQTDPAYVQLRVRELSASSFFEHVTYKAKWGYLTDEIMLVPIRKRLWFSRLKHECQRLVEAHEQRLQQPDSVQARNHYDAMLYQVHDCALEIEAVYINQMNYGLPFQKGFQGNYEFKSQWTAEGRRRRPMVIQEDRKDEDLPFWMISCIGNDKARGFTMDPLHHVRIIEDYLATASDKEAARISQSTYDHISDIMLVDQVRTTIVYKKDRNHYITLDAINRSRSETEKAAFANFMKVVRKLHMAEVCDSIYQQMEDVCVTNPWPTGRKSQAWLDKVDRSRASLSRFWARFRSAFVASARTAGLSAKYVATELKAVSADREPAFQAESKAQREAIMLSLKSPNTSAPVISADDKPLWSQQLPYISAGKENRPPINVKTPKLKTRNAPQHKPAVEPVVEAREATEATPVPHIQVKKQNLRMFQFMFSVAGVEEDSTRKFAWQHFAAAMVDAGFSYEQSSGSSVCFRQLEVVHLGRKDDTADEEAPSGCGSIVFHRPHPDPVIDPVMLKGMGKRLGKWFGWNSETFVERV